MNCPRHIALASCLLLGAGVFSVSTAHAIPADVVGGQTSVLLDAELLESAAGLTISGVSSDVIVPGNLGTDSVAFDINSRSATAPLLPTTFTYDSDAFAPFSGTIEHLGSVFFNDGAIEVGNFTIGFDASRASDDISGFFVESTVGVEAILSDVAPPSSLVATATDLTIAADLLVSPEFAGFLGLDLTGADVGDALVEGIAQADAQVPVPTTLALFALGLIGMGYQQRRAQRSA